MANEQNLKKPTAKEARERGALGGKASAKARAEKRDLRKALEALLEKEITSKDGMALSGAEAIALKQMEKALRGDTKAFAVIRDTAGQKPVDKIMVAEVDQSVIDEVESIVFGEIHEV